MIGNGDRGQSAAHIERIVSNCGNRICDIPVFNVIRNNQISSGVGCVIRIGTHFRHHCSSVVLTVEGVVKRLACAAHQCNFVNGFKLSGKGDVIGDGEGIFGIGADSFIAGVLPAHKSVAAVGSGSQCGRGAVSIGATSSDGAHGLIVNRNGHRTRTTRNFLDVGKVAPAIPCLIR